MLQCFKFDKGVSKTGIVTRMNEWLWSLTLEILDIKKIIVPT